MVHGSGTEIVNEEIPHRFPEPHMDPLLQTINYRVPPDKFDELAHYDGSVIAERTKARWERAVMPKKRTS
jgi:hypothetical protein